MAENQICTGGFIDLPPLLAVCCNVSNFLSMSSRTRFFNPLNPFHDAPIFDRSSENPLRHLINPKDFEATGLYFYLMRCQIIHFIISTFSESVSAGFSIDGRDSAYRETKLFNLIDFFLVSQILAAPHPLVGRNDPLFRKLMSFGFTEADLSPHKQLRALHQTMHNLGNLNCGELACVSFLLFLMLINVDIHKDCSVSYCIGSNFDHTFIMIRCDGKTYFLDPWMGYFGSDEYGEILNRVLSFDGFPINEIRSRIFDDQKKLRFKLYWFDPDLNDPDEVVDCSRLFIEFEALATFTATDIILFQRNPIFGFMHDKTNGYPISNETLFCGSNKIKFALQLLFSQEKYKSELQKTIETNPHAPKLQTPFDFDFSLSVLNEFTKRGLPSTPFNGRSNRGLKFNQGKERSPENYEILRTHYFTGLSGQLLGYLASNQKTEFLGLLFQHFVKKSYYPSMR